MTSSTGLVSRLANAHTCIEYVHWSHKQEHSGKLTYMYRTLNEK